jgi:hypothetical protein
VEAIPDPEAGEGADPGYAAKRFKDGGWVLGIGRDSHGILSKYRGGGTMVVKDSRGRVRCYFGHVCGPRGLRAFMVEAQSPDEFHGRMTEYFGCTEYQWP